MAGASLAPRLLYWADSALPTGGFAFSSGLEAAAKLGLISSREALRDWLEANLEQFADCELLFIAAFADPDEAADALTAYHALTTTPAIRRAQLTQGRALLRLLGRLVAPDEWPRSKAFFDRHARPPYFPAVLGMTLNEQGYDFDDIALLYAYMALRDGVSAAIRLGLIGPMEGHRMQFQLLPQCGELAAAIRGRSWREARRTSPLLDIAQACHERLYSKLFQN